VFLFVLSRMFKLWVYSRHVPYDGVQK
jgi:hypothetical protein